MSNPFPQVWVHYLHGDSTLLCLSRANLNHQQPGLNPHEAHDTICHKPKMRLPLQQTNWPVEKGFFGVLKPVRSSCSSNFGWFNQKKLVSTTIHLIKSYIYITNIRIAIHHSPSPKTFRLPSFSKVFPTFPASEKISNEGDRERPTPGERGRKGNVDALRLASPVRPVPWP